MEVMFLSVGKLYLNTHVSDLSGPHSPNKSVKLSVLNFHGSIILLVCAKCIWASQILMHFMQLCFPIQVLILLIFLLKDGTRDNAIELLGGAVLKQKYSYFNLMTVFCFRSHVVNQWAWNDFSVLCHVGVHPHISNMSFFFRT